MDSYGIATYQEVNPGLFAVVTFPFLFAVMFGDIGHGCIILLAAIYMILSERRMAKAELDEVCSLHVSKYLTILTLSPIKIVGQFFFGRYIILMMGLFSIYTGLIYNDIFSKSLHLFHSGWDFPESNGTVTAVANGHTYPFGLDPGWHGSDNGLVFTNSYKMKMSIVLGVIHVRSVVCRWNTGVLTIQRR